MIKDVRTEPLTVDNFEQYRNDIMMRPAALDQLAQALPTGSLYLILATYNAELVGQVGIIPKGPTEPDTTPYIDYPTPVLTFMEVKPEHRGEGIGHLLVNAACDFAATDLHATGIFLTVGVDNHPARHIYEKSGFTYWGHGPVVRPHFPLQADGYPADPVYEERHVMIKELGTSG